MFDMQAALARNIVIGKKKLPSLEEMKKDISARSKQESEIKSAPDLILLKRDYMKDLLRESEYPFIDFDKNTETWLQFLQDKVGDIMNFRDYVYTSHITGVKSTKHPVKWID